MEKKCSKCKEVKPLDRFSKYNRSKSGRSARCKDCDRKYREANKDAISEGKKKCYHAKKDVYLQKQKQYYQDNKAQCSERIRKYYQANKESTLNYAKEYREANKEAVSERKKKCYHAKKDVYLQNCKHYRQANRKKIARNYKKRIDTDPLFKLTCNIRSLIRVSLSNGGYTKKSKTYEILGCSFDEYYQHIESQFKDGMSWDVISEIHIDHHLPVSAATTEAELLALNHHRNLRPLWKSDNLAKGSNHCPRELALYFSKYLNP
jgi:hypothetical protein